MPIVKAHGLDTYYEACGAGPPLLLIAGNGMDHTCFHEQLPIFQPHFRCLTYDLRGVGRSAVPDEGYTPGEMAQDALALLTALEIPAAHVAGYSLGGAIGQEMVIQAPERVHSLSLYSTYDRAEPYLALRYELLLMILEEASPDIWARFTAFSAFGEDYINAHMDEVRIEIERRVKRASAMDATAKRGLAGHYRAILAHDTADRLDRIACPTWIAVGEVDPVTPPAYSERLHRRIASSELEIFPGRPHRLMNFQPDPFNRAALAFLLRHR
jgi:3-oxoadipate enol-lactonase